MEGAATPYLYHGEGLYFEPTEHTEGEFMMTEEATARRRASLIIGALYFAYFTAGYLWTVFPRQLEELGWSGTEIGGAYAMRGMVGSSLMWLWAAGADRGLRRALLRVQFIVGAIAISALPLLTSTEAILIVFILHGATVGSALPLVDTHAMKVVGVARFGDLRAWGSAGYGALAFAAAVIGFYVSYEELAGLSAWGLVAGAWISVACAMLLPGALARERSEPAEKPPWREAFVALAQRDLLLVLLIGALHWMCQVPYMTYLVSLCETNGLPAHTPGFAVVVAVVTEFVVLKNSSRLFKIARPSTWLLLAMIASGVRWWAMANTGSMAVMIGLQVIHGLSFAAFLLATIKLVTDRIPETSRAQGQALLYLIIFGLGGVLGNALAGPILDAVLVTGLFEVVGYAQLGIIPLTLLLAASTRAASQEPEPRGSP